MNIISNIFFSYFSPIKIFNTSVKISDDSQLFGVLVVGCLFTLIGQFPSLYNLAKYSLTPLVGIFSARLVAILLIMPLVFYVTSGLLYLFLRIFKLKVTSFQTRLSLFWAFTLVSPWGLVKAVMVLLNCPVWLDLSFDIFIFTLFCTFFYVFLKNCANNFEII